MGDNLENQTIGQEQVDKEQQELASAAANNTYAYEAVKNQKAKNAKRAIGKLLGFMKGFRALLVVALIFSLAGATAQIFFPTLVGDMTAIIAGVLPQTIPNIYYVTGGIYPPTVTIPGVPIDMSEIIRLALFVGGLILGGALVSYFQGFIMITVTQKVIQRLRSRIIKKINSLPLKYFDSTSYGDILSRLTNDVDLIGQWLGHLIITLVTSLFLLIGLLSMMFFVNWIMAFTVLGSTLLGAFALVAIMSRSQKYFKRQQKHLGDLNGQIEEVYSNHAIVKAYAAGARIAGRFSLVNKDLQKANGNADFFSIAMHPLMSFVGNLGFVLVFIVGAVLISNGSLAPGVGAGIIAQFLIYVRLFQTPLMQLSEVAQGVQQTAAASERVFEFLDQHDLGCEAHKTDTLPVIKGAIEFKDVRFGYREDKEIIKGFSASIKPGSTVAIVGPTGAGKTTIVNLLMRFYEVGSGQIIIDGVDISTLKREDVANIFGMVLQDTWMFEGTIFNNIAYNASEVLDKEELTKRVVEAAKQANLDHFIKTLPLGYETVLDEKTGISQGQKQLVTIARAFVAAKPLLILDEATSSVDTRTEALIQQALERLSSEHTTFVIAHRLSTIKNADVILVLKDGDIIENGNHVELLANGGFYSELYNAQFSE